MSEIKEWCNSVPFVTRYWWTITAGISFIVRFGALSYRAFISDYYNFIHEFQIWRPLTSLFSYPFGPTTGFHFLINCYFLYNYSQRLEKRMFAGKPADYFYILLFNWLCCVIIGLLVNLPILMDPMELVVLYVWCYLIKYVIMSFWFGTRFKRTYPGSCRPLSLLLVKGVMELLGILIDHLAFFLLIKYPQEFGGPALLTPPTFLKQLFPDTRYVGGFGTAPQAATTARPGNVFGHNWGRGQTLGGN